MALESASGTSVPHLAGPTGEVDAGVARSQGQELTDTGSPAGTEPADSGRAQDDQHKFHPVALPTALQAKALVPLGVDPDKADSSKLAG